MRKSRSIGGRAALLGGAALFAAAGSLEAQNTDWNRYTLEELNGVFVRAEAGPQCQSAGLSSADLTAEAVRTLEEAEVSLLSESEMLASPGLPDLRITVECSQGPDDTIGYSVWLRMQQAAQMVRDPQLQLSEAVTWYTTALGVVDEDRAQRAVEEALAEGLAEFADAFKSANAAEAEAN